MRLFIITLAALLCAAGPKPQTRFPSSWTEPTEPFHLAGPIYYVGTRGIGVFLLKSDAGLILVSGAPGPAADAIASSIKKLGFKLEDIKFILSSHAHFDHSGSLAAHKRMTGAKLIAMEQDAPLLKSGGELDFLFSNRPEFRFEGVDTDQKIKDLERITLGNISLTAHLTPGHTKGCTTWEMDIVEANQTYKVVFADGVTINPGTRFIKKPSYPSILSDYEKTFKTLETLKPEIYLAYHAEFFNMEEKQIRSKSEGIRAWVDIPGFERHLTKRKAAFQTQVQSERKNK